MIFVAGDRVVVTIGVEEWRGSVIWSRNAPPDFSIPACYSVRLDREIRAGYTGTVVPANAVRAEDPS